MKEIPIIIEGTTCGTVRLQKQGAYVLCTGQAQWRRETVRLWVYGEGNPVYLGMLIPEGEGCGLRKKLSLREFSQFPRAMTHCAPYGQEQTTSTECNENDVLWTELGDGTLLGTLGGQRYLALPTLDMPAMPRGSCGLLRWIEGKPYFIFPC